LIGLVSRVTAVRRDVRPGDARPLDVEVDERHAGQLSGSPLKAGQVGLLAVDPAIASRWPQALETWLKYISAFIAFNMSNIHELKLIIQTE
jgi:hypothetical protein